LRPHDCSPAGGDFDDDTLGRRAGHWVEDKLDMCIPLLNAARVAVRALDPTNLHVKYVAGDLRCLLHLPTPRVVVRSKHSGKRERRIDVFGLGSDVTTSGL